jgi:hypothetical protein
MHISPKANNAPGSTITAGSVMHALHGTASAPPSVSFNFAAMVPPPKPFVDVPSTYATPPVIDQQQQQHNAPVATTHAAALSSRCILEPPESITCRTVYVTELPMSFSDEHFRSMMQQFGRIVKSRTFTSTRRVLRTGSAYGFCLYATPDDAAAAIAGLNGLDVAGRRLEVRLSDNGVVKEPMPPAAAAAFSQPPTTSIDDARVHSGAPPSGAFRQQAPMVAVAPPYIPSTVGAPPSAPMPSAPPNTVILMQTSGPHVNGYTAIPLEAFVSLPQHPYHMQQQLQQQQPQLQPTYYLPSLFTPHMQLSPPQPLMPVLSMPTQQSHYMQRNSHPQPTAPIWFDPSTIAGFQQQPAPAFSQGTSPQLQYYYGYAQE